MNDESCIEGTPQVLVGESHSAINVVGYAICFQCCFCKKSTKSFSCETDIICVFRIDTCNKCPGKLMLINSTNLFCFRVCLQEVLLPLSGSRIVSVPRWYSF